MAKVGRFGNDKICIEDPLRGVLQSKCFVLFRESSKKCFAGSYTPNKAVATILARSLEFRATMPLNAFLWVTLGYPSSVHEITLCARRREKFL
jgi:hypothetical protein